MAKALNTTIHVTLPLYTKINGQEVGLGTIDVSVPVSVIPAEVEVDPTLLTGALLESIREGDVNGA